MLFSCLLTPLGDLPRDLRPSLYIVQLVRLLFVNDPTVLAEGSWVKVSSVKLEQRDLLGTGTFTWHRFSKLLEALNVFSSIL